MKEKTIAVVMIDEAEALFVVKKLDRPGSTAAPLASEASTEAASSLALAALAEACRPASASTYDIDVDGVRFAASLVLANVVNYLVAVARVP